MSKLVRVILPLAALALFAAVMLSARWFKTTEDRDQQIGTLLQQAYDNVLEGNWGQARADLNAAQMAWNKIVRWMQLGAEREDILSLGTALARADAGMVVKDRPGVVAELAKAIHVWNRIGARF